MLKFNSLLLSSENPKELAAFYKKVFAIDPGWEEGGYTGFKVGEGMFMVGPHDKVHGENKNPERMLVNFETNDVRKDFERIKKLGAKVLNLMLPVKQKICCLRLSQIPMATISNSRLR